MVSSHAPWRQRLIRAVQAKPSRLRDPGVDSGLATVHDSVAYVDRGPVYEGGNHVQPMPSSHQARPSYRHRIVDPALRKRYVDTRAPTRC